MRTNTPATSFLGSRASHAFDLLAHAPRRVDGTAWVLLALLLSTDMLFVELHMVRAYTPLLDSLLYSIEFDRGYAELFQYIKLFWVVLVLGWLAAARCSAVCASWMLLSGYLLADDVMSIHEHGGTHLADLLALAPAWGLRAVDFGELIVSAMPVTSVWHEPLGVLEDGGEMAVTSLVLWAVPAIVRDLRGAPAAQRRPVDAAATPRTRTR